MNMINKLKNKYVELNQIARVSIWYAASNFMQKIIVVLSVPILTRLLTASEYGVYSVYNSWFEIIYNICTLALASGGYCVGMKNYAESKKQYDSAICSLCICITIFIFSLLSAMPFIWKLILSIPVTYQLPMFIGIISGCPRDFWGASERYSQRYKKLVFVTIFTSIGVLILQVICCLCEIWEDRVSAVIWGSVIPSVLVGTPILISILKKGKVLFDKDIWKGTIEFNVVLIPYYMSITFLNQIDRVMIERFIDAAHAGYYSVAYRAASTINILTVALNQSLMPWVFQKLKANQENEIKKVSIFILISPFIISLILILLAPEVILILSGEEYLVATSIIPTVAIGMCLRFVSQIFINVEMYYEKNNVITISTVAIAVLNFVLNWIFIPLYGFLAAGYTTLVCFAVQTMIHSILVCKCANGKEIFCFKFIWLIILGIIVIGLAFSFIYDNEIFRYGLIFVFAVFIFLIRKKLKVIISEM